MKKLFLLLLITPNLVMANILYATDPVTKETLISNNSFLTNSEKAHLTKYYLNNENFTLAEINENIGSISINAKLIVWQSDDGELTNNDKGILYIKHGEKILHHIDCNSGCNLMVASSDKPLIRLYDGSVIAQGKGARIDGGWKESKHIHNMSAIKKIPVFKATNLSRKKNVDTNRYIGFIINSYGNSWGRAELILVNVDTGSLITKESQDKSYPNFVRTFFWNKL